MRDDNFAEASIRAAIHSENALRCSPPLDQREVETIIKSVMRYEPGRGYWAVGDAFDDSVESWLEAQEELIENWARER